MLRFPQSAHPSAPSLCGRTALRVRWRGDGSFDRLRTNGSARVGAGGVDEGGVVEEEGHEAIMNAREANGKNQADASQSEATRVSIDRWGSRGANTCA